VEVPQINILKTESVNQAASSTSVLSDADDNDSKVGDSVVSANSPNDSGDSVMSANTSQNSTTDAPIAGLLKTSTSKVAQRSSFAV
jgi:hypothetical protein